MVLSKPYSLTKVVNILNARLYQEKNKEAYISHLLLDSRQLTNPSETLFFAIKTKKNDGHHYISTLVEQGVRHFVVTRLPENLGEMPEETSFLLVQDCLAALQKLAAFHRKSFDGPVIGITGSNGKTIVKEWLHQLLSFDWSVVRSPKSYNSQIGVPLSVWQIEPEHQLAIFEAGISEPGEMSHLQQMIQPTIGIFTNIGPAHGENFIRIQQKVGEKLKLFTKVETLIYCSDHPEVQEGIIRSQLLHSIKSFTWSRKNDANLRIIEIEKTAHQSTIKAEYQSLIWEFSIPFTDDASVENAIHCACVLLLLNVKTVQIAHRMTVLTPVAMRLELKEGMNNCTLINDSYNSDIHSLSIALDFLKQQNQHQTKTVILSDILESGTNEADLYEQVALLMELKGVHKLIGIGPALMRQAGKFKMEKTFYASTDDFLAAITTGDFQSSSILIKGARVFGFERISQLLQQKAHETILEINLNNLVSNLNHYKSLLHEGVKIMVMVKAFSYGSGGYEIANVLQFHHVDYLTVAYADEGVELRKAGIHIPIMVMSPEEHSFDAMLHYDLEPEIFSFRVLELLEEAIKRIDRTRQKVKVHIKIDTGMRRLGFSNDELSQLADRLKENPLIQVQSVFSHLAASETAEHDTFTQQQLSTFEQGCHLLRQRLETTFDRHILNSAGIVRFPEAHFDMVRLGIGIYGVASGGWEHEKLLPVLALQSSLSQTRLVKKGESVGYNRRTVVEHDTKVGIVPIGYADGLPRLLSNGKGVLFVNNQPVKIVGDVCMDMCMVDLTNINAEEGDTVIVFDDQHSLNAFATAAQTIPYEILTRISRRVKRVYYQE
jgi:alanine racemase